MLSINKEKAEKIEGVVKIVTCFDVAKDKHYYPTAGHPWSTDEVKFVGDDIAAVVAEDEVSAARAIRALEVEYEEYPVVTDIMEAMKDDAPQLHKRFPNNILAHTKVLMPHMDMRYVLKVVVVFHSFTLAKI